jgi:hypothetical protein
MSLEKLKSVTLTQFMTKEEARKIWPDSIAEHEECNCDECQIYGFHSDDDEEWDREEI